MARLHLLTWSAACLGIELAVFAQSPPQFRSSTELVVVESQVVGRDGRPLEGLTAADFEVFIDGRRRPVVNVNFVSMGAETPATSTGGKTEISEATGRLVLVAVDEASFPVSAQHAAREAVRRVLARANPADHVGLVAYPSGLEIPPGLDREPITKSLGRLVGARVDFDKSRFNLSVTEATLLKSRSAVDTQALIERECLKRGIIADQECEMELFRDAEAITTRLEHQAMLTLDGIHRALDRVSALPGRKVFIVISAGLPMANRVGVRPNFEAETTRIARRAAAANVTLYVFYMNTHFIQYFSPEYAKVNRTVYDDVSLFGLGLEKFADAGGGAFFQIEVDSDPFVDRAFRETSALYVLGVQAEANDRDGKEHFIRVAVKRGGATVRYRRVLHIPAAGRQGTQEFN